MYKCDIISINNILISDYRDLQPDHIETMVHVLSSKLTASLLDGCQRVDKASGSAERHLAELFWMIGPIVMYASREGFSERFLE